MPSVKTVWAKCPIPETNNQVGFVQLDRTTAEALIASGKVEDPMKGEKGITEPYTTCSSTPPVVVPKVLASAIINNEIHVIFDQPMKMTCDIKDQINIIMGGSATVHHPTEVQIVNDAVIFVNGGNHSPQFPMTWAYDDQGPCELTDMKGIEADNQTYGVTKPDDHTKFVSAHTYNGWGVEVTLSDHKGYASDHNEWEIKVGGTVVTHQHVSGHGTDKFTVTFTKAEHPTAPMKAGDVITVSHTKGSGIEAFTDQPVTNNLV